MPIHLAYNFEDLTPSLVSETVLPEEGVYIDFTTRTELALARTLFFYCTEDDSSGQILDCPTPFSAFDKRNMDDYFQRQRAESNRGLIIGGPVIFYAKLYAENKGKFKVLAKHLPAKPSAGAE